MQRTTDTIYLNRAIDLADKAVAQGNHPFGAVLVSADGKVLMEAINTFSVDGGPGHAEANLAREAVRKFETATLRAATLYTSVEPCTMCAGTIYWANIGTVVFAMSDNQLGEITDNNPDDPADQLDYRAVFASKPRSISVRGPIADLVDRVAAQHTAFWASKS